MTIDRRLLAGALGLTLALAACGGSSTASPAATAAASAAATPAAPSDAVTPVPAESASAAPGDAATDNPGAQPSFQAGAAADLEALLPSEAGGLKLQKSSFDGSTLGGAALGIDTGSLKPILDKYGKSISDVRVAIATTTDAPSASGSAGAMVIALQIKGVPAEQLLGVTGMDTANLTKTTVAGKDVYSAGAGGISVIVYPKDDIVFEVLLASDTVAQDIVRQLP